MTLWEHGFDSRVRKCLNLKSPKICQNAVRGYLIIKNIGCYDLLYIFMAFRCLKVWKMFITFV